jgi:hypothetical protein
MNTDMIDIALAHLQRERIKEQTLRFSAISLAEMEDVKLMNRTDTKFLLPRRRISSLLDQLREDYRMLEVAGHRLCAYETLYFDTPDLRYYHDHQSGRSNRYKIRQRRYVESDLLFTEVKHKTNKGRTVKERIQNREVQPLEVRPTQLDAESRAFVNSRTNGTPLDLRPVLWVGYRRITLVGRYSPERITLDLDLSFADGQRQRDFGGLAIAEVKQDARQASAFLDLMKQQGVRSGSISKYCLGVVSLDRTIKHNRFKPQLRHLQKIINQ